MIQTIALPDNFFDDKPEVLTKSEFCIMLKRVYTEVDQDRAVRLGMCKGLLDELKYERARRLEASHAEKVALARAKKLEDNLKSAMATLHQYTTLAGMDRYGGSE